MVRVDIIRNEELPVLDNRVCDDKFSSRVCQKINYYQLVRITEVPKQVGKFHKTFPAGSPPSKEPKK